MKRTMKSFRLNAFTSATLKNLAKEEDRTQTEIIEEALRTYRMITILAESGDTKFGYFAREVLDCTQEGG